MGQYLLKNGIVSIYGIIFYLCIYNIELKGKTWYSFINPCLFKIIGKCVEIFWAFTIFWLSLISLINSFLLLHDHLIFIPTLLRAQDVFFFFFYFCFYFILPSSPNPQRHGIYLDLRSGNKKITLEDKCKSQSEKIDPVMCALFSFKLKKDETDTVLVEHVHF